MCLSHFWMMIPRTAVQNTNLHLSNSTLHLYISPPPTHKDYEDLISLTLDDTLLFLVLSSFAACNTFLILCSGGHP